MSNYESEVFRQPKELERIISNPHEHALDIERPIRLFGIGTSLHACRIAEFWFRHLSQDAIDVRAEEAHYPALYGNITAETQVIVVSHRGTKRYPNAILERAQAAGAPTIVVTAVSEAAPQADIVLSTCSPDLASTHTVSYTSALAVLAQLVSNTLGQHASVFRNMLQAVPHHVQASLDSEIPDDLPLIISRAERILVTGFGIDAITADEAALKLKEGTYMWADSLSVEFALHGPPAAYDDRLVALIMRPDDDDGERTRSLSTLLTDLSVPFATVGTDSDHMQFAPSHLLTRPFASVVPFQRLVGLLAPYMASNPDTIRTDVSPWDTAMKKIEL